MNVFIVPAATNNVSLQVLRFPPLSIHVPLDPISDLLSTRSERAMCLVVFGEWSDPAPDVSL